MMNLVNIMANKRLPPFYISRYWWL